VELYLHIPYVLRHIGDSYLSHSFCIHCVGKGQVPQLSEC